jgi:mannose/fructose/N-acetylgalactosamine-specific phosphotransferase system component IIB
LLIDDQVVQNEWERDLYRLGVPPGMEVDFVAADEAAEKLASLAADGSRTIVIVADIDTLGAACRGTDVVRRINVGGVHEAPGRTRRLRYVFLTEDEARKLEGLAGQGIEITAQDVPTAKSVPLAEFA